MLSKIDLSRAHDPVAVEAKLRRLDRDREIHIHHLGMASRRITESEPANAHWYCLRLKTGRECSVEKTLTDADVETIFPVIKIEERKVRGRLFLAYSKPIMPGYMLVRIVPSPGAFAGLSEVRDVVGIVGNLAMPHRISDEIAKRFKWMETANTIATEPSKVAFADKEVVRVVEGPFAGMIGKMTRAYEEGVVQGRIMVASYGNILPVTLPLAFLKKI